MKKLNEDNFPKHELLIDKLPCIFAIINIDRQFINWNKRFEAEIGYDANEIAAMSPEMLFSESYRPLIQEKIEETFNTGHVELEIYITAKSGKQIPYYITADLTEYNNQNCITAIGINITDRKSIENRLANTEERNNLALAGIDAGIWDFYDFENKLLYLSPKYLELIGRKSEKRIYSLEEVESWIYPSDLKALQDTFYYHVNYHTEHYQHEARFILPDGSYKWFSFSGKAGYDKAGNPKRATGSIIDIDSRKKTEAKLLEHEEQLTLFFEHSPVALAMFDRNMCYVAASKRWIHDLKMDSESVIGKSHYKLFPEITDEWKAIHQRVLNGETIRNNEEAFIRKDGAVDWLRWEVLPWHKVNGEIGGIIIFTEVITEQKEGELKFRNLVEKSLVGVYIIQEEKYVYVNPKYCEIFGYTEEELIGQSPLDLVYEPDRHIAEETKPDANAVKEL